ncbi:MAG: hypothetical protein LBT44_09215 [Clostridiales bacterium]|jgi:hypothetical protein|nr:hypothetical protein [Clostridiales bacterium]
MNHYHTNCKSINQIFKDKFLNAYHELKKRKKTRILKYISSIYRRWFYSALVEDTSLTPANLFAMLDVGEVQETPPVFRSPVIRPLKTGRGSFDFPVMAYSAEAHPVIEDLKIFVECCMPDVGLDSNDMLQEEYIEAIMEKVSLWDPYYVEYLLNTSILLGLLKKSPSIYANRARVCDSYESILGLPQDELFKKVVNATISGASAFINEMIPLPEPYFTIDVITSLLKSPMALDDIFQEVYGMLGVKLEDIYNIEDEDPFSDDMNSAVISSTFLLGLLLDKCFLTPFGYYLRLIRPLYTLSYEFENELNYLVESFDEEEGPITALYAPATYYQLTPLGKAFFGVTDSGKASSQATLPFDALMNLVEGRVQDPQELMKLLKTEFALAIDARASIYVIKIRLFAEKSLWKNVEIPGNTNLHQFFGEICYQFSLDPSSEYSFFQDITESPFSEYTSHQHPRRNKKAHAITLQEMNLPEKHKFVLVIYNTFNPYVSFDEAPMTKKMKIELEILKVKPREEGQEYPRLARVSSAFKDLEN